MVNFMGLKQYIRKRKCAKFHILQAFHSIWDKDIFWNNIWRKVMTKYAGKPDHIITVWGKVRKVSCKNKLDSNLLPNTNKKPWWIYIINLLCHLTLQTFNSYCVVYIYDCFWQILCPMQFCGENPHKAGKRSPGVIISADKTCSS